jgi:hypothetical protein
VSPARVSWKIISHLLCFSYLTIDEPGVPKFLLSSTRGTLTCFCGSTCKSPRTTETHLQNLHHFSILRGRAEENAIEEKGAAIGDALEGADRRDAADMQVEETSNHRQEPPVPNPPFTPAQKATNSTPYPIPTSPNSSVAQVAPATTPQSTQPAFSQSVSFTAHLSIH